MKQNDGSQWDVVGQAGCTLSQSLRFCPDMHAAASLLRICGVYLDVACARIDGSLRIRYDGDERNGQAPPDSLLREIAFKDSIFIEFFLNVSICLDGFSQGTPLQKTSCQ